MNDDLVQFARAEIWRHVAEHPDSVDTLEGIHQWWIHWPGPGESLHITLAALEQLKLDGLMESRPVGQHLLWLRHRSDQASL